MANVNSFSLFNDVEDKQLRAYNRARIMVNIMEDYANPKGEGVLPKGGHLVLQYFERIPVEDRVAAMDEVSEILKKKGINVDE